MKSANSLIRLLRRLFGSEAKKIKRHATFAEETPAFITPKRSTLSEPAYKSIDLAGVDQKGDELAVHRGRETGIDFPEVIREFFASSQKATQPLVILGIDLGTSFSKVVRRLGKEDVKPVCFGNDSHNLAGYLVPSIVAFDGKRVLSGFNATALGESTISNFKMCLACESKQDDDCNISKCPLTLWSLESFPAIAKGVEAKFVSAVFLADLITESKKLILAEFRNMFAQNVAPKWEANFAIPDSFIEDSAIANTFQEVFRVAWLMSGVFLTKPVKRDVNTLFNCYIAACAFARDSLEVLTDAEFGCSPYPEVGAEVASIVMSKTSETGLYGFVDVGGGTVDASIFRYFRDGANAMRPPYAANVSNKIGAAQIEVRASLASGFPDGGFSISYLKYVKESVQPGEVTEESLCLSGAASQLKEEVADHLNQVLKLAYSKEPFLDRWQDLRLILGGGGANLSCYRDASMKGFSISQNGGVREPDISPLNIPDDFNLQGLPTSSYLRFAVAYGLSFPISDLPEPDFCKDVEPIAPLLHYPNNYGDWYGN